MRSNITGTTHKPVARWVSTRARVASGSNFRRVTMVHDIDAANANCEKPQAWNIGATITTVSSVRQGVRSRIDFSTSGPPPEWLAPFGLPVVPEVSRMTLLFSLARTGVWPAWSRISFSTVMSGSALSVQAITRVTSGESVSARSTVEVNSSS